MMSAQRCWCKNVGRIDEESVWTCRASADWQLAAAATLNFAQIHSNLLNFSQILSTQPETQILSFIHVLNFSLIPQLPFESPLLHYEVIVCMLWLTEELNNFNFAFKDESYSKDIKTAIVCFTLTSIAFLLAIVLEN